VTTDYTDIVARFSEQLAAETLAKHLASVGITCDVVGVSDNPMGLECYGVRVARNLIAEMKDVLKLTRVGIYSEAISPQIVAGRLARENIPCFVGLRPALGVGPYGIGYSAVPIDDTGELAGGIAVPAKFAEAARRILDKPPLREIALTDLALRTPPDPNDPT
jgi:hypothetical protein